MDTTKEEISILTGMVYRKAQTMLQDAADTMRYADMKLSQAEQMMETALKMAKQSNQAMNDADSIVQTAKYIYARTKIRNYITLGLSTLALALTIYKSFV